jgi:hypothetical protein
MNVHIPFINHHFETTMFIVLGNPTIVVVEIPPYEL